MLWLLLFQAITMASSSASPRGEGGRRVDGFASLFPGHSMAELFAILRALGIETRTDIYHQQGLRNGMEGIFCKNLFLKDRKGQFYYLICFEDWKVDLKLLKQKLNAHRNFSFGTPADVEYFLGLQPGNVSPFGLLNPNSKSIRLVIDHRLTVSPHKLNFHPLLSELTTLLSFSDLNRFITHCGHEYELIDID